MSALLETVRIVWSFACSAAVVGLVALIFRNQLLAVWHRLWQSSAFPARHRIKETTVAIESHHLGLPEPIRAMVLRGRQPAVEGRGRHWASDALHGETMTLPLVALPSAEAAPVELEAVA